MGRRGWWATCVVLAGCAVSNEALPGYVPDADAATNESDAYAAEDSATQDAAVSDAARDANTAPTGGSSGEDAGTGGVSGSGGAAGVGGAAGNGGESGSSGAGGTGPVCECTGVNDCCDGCNALNPCDYMVTEPQCQAAICNPITGCSFVPVARQGLACDDGNDVTNVDRCDQGVCVGRTCECTTGPCCDGCHLMPREEPSSLDEEHNLNYCRAVSRFECSQGHQTETVIATYCSGTSPLCDGEFQSIGATATACGHDCRTSETCDP